MTYYRVCLYNGCGGTTLEGDCVVMYVKEDALLNNREAEKMVEYVNEAFNTPGAAPYYYPDQQVERVDLSQPDIDKCKARHQLYPIE